MESSRRAVEAYRRTRLIDGVTTDDDKVAPVYKLDEISSVLRSAPHDVVHEMVEYVFKRLEHKSPLVKQKTLRFIKFEVGKSGTEFKREIQRQSAAIRQLFHYQGQPDSLRGDSLNKAVRETAREAITAMFASDEKPPALEETSRRIEGFGSTNFDSRASQEKKTLLSEVVDIGTASIKQGLTMISSHYGHFGSSNGTKSKSSSGSYEAPNLRRSVSERDNFKYRDNHRDSYSYSESRDTYRETYRGGASEEMSYEQPDSPKSDAADEKSEDANGLTQEEKLLDTVTAVGGVRLQPSREAIQSFLLAAQVLNPQRLHQAFEQKLQVHSWQVRLKTLCFLEAVLRQRAVKPFGDVSQRFEANHASVIDCMDSPQSSLREKANKVLGLLQTETEEGSQVSNDVRIRQPKRTERVEMPDLIDTNDDDSSTHQKDEVDILSSLTEASPVQGDLLGDGLHENTETNGTSSLFEGLSIAEEPSKKPASATNISDLLGSLDTGTPSFQQQSNLDPGFGQDFSGLMGLEPQPQQQQQQGLSRAPPSFVSPSIPGGAEFIMAKFDAARRFAPQAQAHYPGTAPPLYGFGQAPPAQQHSFQQQQDFSGGFGMGFGSQGASFASDAFDFSSHPYSSASASLPRMEETTKAFDFISDHMSAARTTKK